MLRNLIILLFCLLCSSAIKAGNPQLAQNFNLHKAFSFEENKGQLADDKGQLLPDILYYGRDKGVNVYCFKDKIAFVFTKATAAPQPPEGITPQPREGGAITDSPFIMLCHFPRWMRRYGEAQRGAELRQYLLKIDTGLCIPP